MKKSIDEMIQEFTNVLTVTQPDEIMREDRRAEHSEEI